MEVWKMSKRYMQEHNGYKIGDKIENYEYLWEKGQAEIIDIYEETTVWYVIMWRPYTKAGKISKRGIREFKVTA
jgi:hypothetical protein